jgi:hypothetical protein
LWLTIELDTAFEGRRQVFGARVCRQINIAAIFVLSAEKLSSQSSHRLLCGTAKEVKAFLSDNVLC